MTDHTTRRDFLRTAAAVTSRRESCELYRRAVANLPQDLPIAEAAAVWDEYSGAASSIDDIAITSQALDHARTCYLEAGDPVRAAQMLTWRAGPCG